MHMPSVCMNCNFQSSDLYQADWEAK
jgi:hypothetical protein